VKRRSNEPVFWGVFAAGGVVAALTLPAMILVTGLLGPSGALGPDAIGYERAAAFAGHWAGKLVLLALVVSPMWLAGHRIFHSLHDLGIDAHRGLARLVCYGLAALGSVLAVVALLGIG
jgi:fumarate reductase subunit D